MKRNYLKYITIGAMMLLSIACTKDFSKINTDITRFSPDVFDANYFMTNSQINYANEITGDAGPLLFESGWAQILAMPGGAGDYFNNADKYVASSNTNTYTSSSWNNGYTAATYANEILLNTINNPNSDSTNVKAIAVIMKVMSIQYVTDVYGDCPYSEAFQARYGNTTPVYDKQQDVYNALLSDLDKALSLLDASKKGPVADASSLSGDVGKWKRFGYSLMLRLAMRLTKADAGAAKTWAEKAAAGGTLNAGENMYLARQRATGYGNGNAAEWLLDNSFYMIRWSKTLIDYLKSVNDPRLGIASEVPQAGKAANDNTTLDGDKTPANQQGLPNGYDLTPTSSTYIGTASGYPGGTGSGSDVALIGKYSRPAISVYASFDLPVFVMSYAESELLLAEAAARGWNAGGTAATHYKNAVSGAVQTINVYSPGVVSAATADAYATAHPLDVSTTENSLKMINTQYWATTGLLFNFGEAWINWKRSGYPVLTPVNFSGNFSNGAIPRRQIYPPGEGTLNPANYKNAVSGLSGGDAWSSKVWWDQ
jgi:hypothetical protein